MINKGERKRRSEETGGGNQPRGQEFWPKPGVPAISRWDFRLSRLKSHSWDSRSTHPFTQERNTRVEGRETRTRDKVHW